LSNNRAVRIRLNRIDCPEKGQAYGMKAKQATSPLAFGKEVTLETHGRDKYGRTIADVSLSDGISINIEWAEPPRAGGISNTRLKMWSCRSCNAAPDEQGSACGEILIRCRCGSGEGK
jgi:hypothetical protein